MSEIRINDSDVELVKENDSYSEVEIDISAYESFWESIIDKKSLKEEFESLDVQKNNEDKKFTLESITGAIENYWKDFFYEPIGEQTESSNETERLTEEEKLQKIQDFIDGKIKFDEVKEIFAEYYADAVNSNKPWSWGENIPGGDELTASQKKEVCEYAREQGLVPTVDVREENGKRYADFSEHTIFETTLDKEDWTKTDKEQFSKCNENLKEEIERNPELAKQFTEKQLEQIKNGETPEGYTWHHSEKDGTMQLVSFGVHNSTNHHGGRSEGHWAAAPR